MCGVVVVRRGVVQNPQTPAVPLKISSSLLRSLECTICANYYNESLNAPLNLGCGHCFCMSCLKIVKQKMCFICGVEFKNVDQLPRNWCVVSQLPMLPALLEQEQQSSTAAAAEGGGGAVASPLQFIGSMTSAEIEVILLRVRQREMLTKGVSELSVKITEIRQKQTNYDAEKDQLKASAKELTAQAEDLKKVLKQQLEKINSRLQEVQLASNKNKAAGDQNFRSLQDAESDLEVKQGELKALQREDATLAAAEKKRSDAITSVAVAAAIDNARRQSVVAEQFPPSFFASSSTDSAARIFPSRDKATAEVEAAAAAPAARAEYDRRNVEAEEAIASIEADSIAASRHPPLPINLETKVCKKCVMQILIRNSTLFKTHLYMY